MPPVRKIDLSDGIRIEGNNFPEVWIKREEFPPVRDREWMEWGLNRTLQQTYEVKTRLSEYPDDDPVRQDPPQLLINQRIERIRRIDYVVSITMYVAVHVYSTSPLKYTVKCQNSRAGPIEGEWWL